jgi:hypothetical protein
VSPLRLSSLCAVGLLAAVVAAGCGASHARKGDTVTVSGYNVFPPATVVGPHDPRQCRADAESFADDARQFLAHSGPRAAYPADLAFVMLREVLADFRARRCDPKLMGDQLRRRLTASQRQAFVSGLPRAMSAAVRQALADS